MIGFLTQNIVPPAPVTKLVLKLNFGGTGGAPSNAGWINVWGEPYVDADLTADVDFGQLGTSGIGLRNINTDSSNCWGEFGNSAIGNAGVNTGSNSGVYPDTVMLNYWFVSNRIATIEIYNQTGTPLNGKTWKIRCFPSRASAGSMRRTKFAVNGSAYTFIDSNDNSTTYAEFTGISPVSGVITINIQNSADNQFGYLNAMEIIEE